VSECGIIFVILKCLDSLVNERLWRWSCGANRNIWPFSNRITEGSYRKWNIWCILVGVEENALTLECFLFPRYDVLDFTDWNSVCADFKLCTFIQEAAHFSQMKSLFSGVIGSFKVFSNILRKHNSGILDTESIDFLL
jgi:hypothetical protein